MATRAVPADLDRLTQVVARLFRALGEPGRLRVVRALCDGERSVKSIALTAGVTEGTVSRHVRTLHEAGVVARRRQGAFVLYRLADPRLSDLCRQAAKVLAQVRPRPSARHSPADVFAGRRVRQRRDRPTA